jgi:uncharacterized membrane protein YkoI
MKELRSMSGRRRFMIIAAILLLVAFGAGAALASGSDAGGSKAPAAVEDDGHDSESPDATESDEVEDADEPGDAAEDESEGPDQPITGPDLEWASKVALDYTGGGRVTGTEIEDEESYYEIEVTRDDGSQVDVQLDKSFNVVGTD